MYFSQRWFLYPPSHSPLFNPDETTLRWVTHIYPSLPDKPLECTLNPGEVRHSDLPSPPSTNTVCVSRSCICRISGGTRLLTWSLLCSCLCSMPDQCGMLLPLPPLLPCSPLTLPSKHGIHVCLTNVACYSPPPSLPFPLLPSSPSPPLPSLSPPFPLPTLKTTTCPCLCCIC